MPPLRISVSSHLGIRLSKLTGRLGPDDSGGQLASGLMSGFGHVPRVRCLVEKEFLKQSRRQIECLYSRL